MATTSVLPWLRDRRVVVLIAALTLAASLALVMIGNSWTATAASEDPAGVVVEAETIAGPSWTLSVRSAALRVVQAPAIEVSVGLNRG